MPPFVLPIRRPRPPFSPAGSRPCSSRTCPAFAAGQRMSEALKAHLVSGVTTICRAWAVTRRDGAVLGFTDHDTELSFEGVVFQPETGMTAAALAQSTGLSVDNTEALGALSSEAVTEEDILAGRYDAAEIIAWSVNWADAPARDAVSRHAGGDRARRRGVYGGAARGFGARAVRRCNL